MKKCHVQCSFLALFVFALALTGARAASVTLVPLNSSWRYIKGTNEASVPSTAWRGVVFNDASWLTGNASIGYGDSDGLTTATDIGPASSVPNYLSLYMRKTFTVANPGAYSEITGTLRVDDGAVVYLNGVELGRVNVPAGELTFNDAAVAALELSTLNFTTNGAALIAGNNVLAVHVFNANLTSSDLLMDVTLTAAIDDTAPFVEQVTPPAGATVRSLQSLLVYFSEPVTGINASDLRINGVAATNLTVISPREYQFEFPAQPTGSVAVEWIAGHGIVDSSVSANPFAGGSWAYTIDPNVMLAGVILNEFLADNNTNYRDENNAQSDWIEILNAGEEVVNLGGWFLTDSKTNLTKWRIPSFNLFPNDFRVIFASSKDRTDVSVGRLHTNFGLSKDGEYLALVDAQTNVVSEYDPYPGQEQNISYGRDRADPTVSGYFSTPTPNLPNSAGGPGFAPLPVFSLPGGFYTNANLSVTLSAASGTIRYTRDGTNPTESSPAYAGAFTLTTNTVVRARVFQPGLLPSAIVVQNYSLMGAGLSGFSSKLPIVIVDTRQQGIVANVLPGGARTKASMIVIDTFRGRAALTDVPQFSGLIEMEVRGQSSSGFAKKSYGIEVVDANALDLDVPLLGLPADSDWALIGPYAEKTFINNPLAYELHAMMGHYAVRWRLVELFVDVTGGKLDYIGDYAGIYTLVEKIKINKDRVDVERLTPDMTTEPNITGGYIFKKDKDTPGADLTFNTTGSSALGFVSQQLRAHDPKPREITTPQVNYLRTYLNQFEQALYATDWLTRTGTNHYSHYIDVDSFVDHHWIVEFAKQIDGYRISNYMTKDRGQKVKMEPIWDWNLAFGNANYLQGGRTNGWYWNLQGEGMTSNEHIWLRRLVYGLANIDAGNPVNGPGDPDFLQKIVDRWSVLRTNLFHPDRVNARITEFENQLDEAAVRDIAKWITPEPWTGYRWPNPDTSWDVNYATPPNFAYAMGQMRKFITGRFLWIDSQYVPAPELSSGGGDVNAGSTLSITARSGTVYYTTDGTDPRLPGGAINPAAQTYNSPIVINGNARVFARARLGTAWSGPRAATFVVSLPTLIISEIMYHPAPPPVGNTNDADNFEFIEIKNIGNATVNLARIRFTEGITFNFSGSAVTTLGAGQSAVVVANLTAFTSRYGVVSNVAGQYVGSLNNGGEKIILLGAVDEVLHNFSYEDDWYPSTDGIGFSLVVANQAAARSEWDRKTGWRFGVRNGTPGQSEAAPGNIAAILVNEVVTHTDLPAVDSIELHNPTGADVDLGGWFLTDDTGLPKYRIPDNTMILANGFLTFDEADFNPTPGTGASFALRATGDEVFLLSADALGNLTGYVHGHDFGASLNGVSFGRYINSQGAEHFVAQQSQTVDAANSGPRVGPVVISEVMYRPRDVFANNGYWDNFEEEFVELSNISGSPVPLFDPAATTNSWGLRDAVDFTFPPNITLAAGERILVVNFHPTGEPAKANAFRTRYGLSGLIRLFGPYAGKLDNSGESVELFQPDVVDLLPSGFAITRVLADKVAYADDGFWPLAADGIGHSLQRISNGAYGNDPVNWVAAAATPGAANAFGPAPTITQQPASRTAIATANVTFNVGVTGSGPFQYQWRFKGANLFGAVQPSLTITNVDPSDAGEYQVVVLNAANSAASALASLTVLIPASILTHPQPLDALPGANVTFRVAASSSTPISFQWRRNGVPITGATAATLEILGVQPSHDGIYDVVVTDAVGSISSQGARLTVLVPPTIVVQPFGNTNALVGSSHTFSVQITNTATLPLGFRWRRGGTTITTHVLNSHTDFFTLTNLQTTQSGNYNAIVTNKANFAPGLQTMQAQVTVVTSIPDADGDGLPDSYEMAHGLNKNVADAHLDADGDGMSNRDEYTSGTDPQDPASYLKVDQVTNTGAVVIQFRAARNRTYSVLFSDGTMDGPWGIIGGAPALSATDETTRSVTVSDTNPPVGGERFYRLVSPARPAQ